LLTDRFPKGTAEGWLAKLAAEVAEEGVDDESLAEIAAQRLLKEQASKTAVS